jgi:hypothetical protein
VDDKTRIELERREEIGAKLRSIMAHTEWPLLKQMITDEVNYHRHEAEKKAYRKDPALHGNIVRALDAADAIEVILTKIDTAVTLGDDARKRINATREAETAGPAGTKAS